MNIFVDNCNNSNLLTIASYVFLFISVYLNKFQFKNAFHLIITRVGDPAQSATKDYLILVFESPVWSGYWVPGGPNQDRDRLAPP